MLSRVTRKRKVVVVVAVVGRMASFIIFIYTCIYLNKPIFRFARQRCNRKFHLIVISKEIHFVHTNLSGQLLTIVLRWCTITQHSKWLFPYINNIIPTLYKQALGTTVSALNFFLSVIVSKNCWYIQIHFLNYSMMHVHKQVPTERLLHFYQRYYLLYIPNETVFMYKYVYLRWLYNVFSLAQISYYRRRMPLVYVHNIILEKRIRFD